MVRHINVIFSQGALRPIEPLALPEGTRVHLTMDDGTNVSPTSTGATVRTPRLAHPEDAADFVMEVREIDDAGV